jgi:hypothetical protein
MAETMEATVLHVVSPEELADHDLEPELERLAESRYVLVCRAGGEPSIIERVKSFLLRSPIEAVTLVADDAASEGDEVTATVAETDLPGVYEATSLESEI